MVGDRRPGGVLILVRGRLSTVLVAAGTVLLLGGLLAGIANRNVLDGPRFAQHVDAIRSDPAVARQIGRAITDRVLAADPDLVAVRPLIEAAAVVLVRSPALTPTIQATTSQLHRAFTRPNSGQVVLRLADVGVVLAATIRAVSPQAAAQLPARIDVTLAQVGGQSYAARTIALTRLVRTLSWLLPVLALCCFGAALLLSTDKRRAAMHLAVGVTCAGFALGAATLAGTLLTSTADGGTLEGALTVAAWQEIKGSLWWATVLVLLAGGLLLSAATAWRADLDLPGGVRRAGSWLIHRPDSLRSQVTRVLLLVVTAACLLLRPLLAIRVFTVLLGLVLLVLAMSELAAVVAARDWVEDARGRPFLRRQFWLPTAIAVVGTAVVVSLLTVDAQPAGRLAGSPVEAGSSSQACNGFVVLCGRRYDQVAFPATHNSMTAADESGWFFPEQPTGVIGQLNAGIRVFLIDSWLGQTTQRQGITATAPTDRARALAEVEQTYGPAALSSALRLQNALGLKPTGPAEPYLCHGLCEFGSTLWEPLMVRVRAWLVAHPREVVTFFIQDEVSPVETARVFEEAGLLPFVRIQLPGEPWPTLGQMIDSGKRVVVLMENHGGGASYPWLLPGFDWVQDTPYDFASAADFSCARFRGTPTSPLLLVNHWLNRFRSRVSDSATVNAYDVLWPRLRQCQAQRGMIPNFVAVNYYDLGDLFGAVNRLNGVG